jgi:hypothetical protein
MYLSDAPAGAVAEAFGTLARWTSGMFERPDLPGSVRALGSYEISEEVAVFDLDDAGALQTLGLRPSQVVTRDRSVTQRWALGIHELGSWAGVRWWSYYDPRWYCCAIWEIDALTLRSGGVHPLHLQDPAVKEASEVLGRPRE